MFNNFSFPTAYQWKRIGVNALLAFMAGFTLHLVSVGSSINDPTIILTYDFVASTFVGSITAGTFAVYKFIVSLFEESQK